MMSEEEIKERKMNLERILRKDIELADDRKSVTIDLLRKCVIADRISVLRSVLEEKDSEELLTLKGEGFRAIIKVIDCSFNRIFTLENLNESNEKLIQNLEDMNRVLVEKDRVMKKIEENQKEMINACLEELGLDELKRD